jgi:hypothetical protein
MAIDSVPSTSESVPNQEQVSVMREDDRSLSISIFVDASATASADSESSSDSATGAEQAKNDVDGTDASYPTDQAGENETNSSYKRQLLTLMEDLSAKIVEIMGLLGSQIGVTDQEDGLIPLPGGDLIGLFNRMDSEGQNEFIALLESGEFGEGGMKLAEALLNPALQNDERSEEYIHAYNEHARLLLDREFSQEILMAMDPIYEEHQMTRSQSVDPYMETDKDSETESVGDAPLDPNASGEGGGNEELMLMLGGLIADVEQVQEMLGGGGESAYSPAAEVTGSSSSADSAIPQDGDTADTGAIAVQPVEPDGVGITDGESDLGESIVHYFDNMNSQDQDEVIDMLSSGEFGEDGVKIAEVLEKYQQSLGQPNEAGDYLEPNEIDIVTVIGIMNESDEAQEILSAIESL